MENHAKYGDTIYFHSADALFVNLFIPSELTWKDKGLTVRQETRFPDEERTTLTIRCTKPVSLALKIRRPAWAGDEVEISVNGKPEKIDSVAGSYISLERTWRSDDRVELTLPMRLHTESLPDDSNTVAVLYGPIVLAAEMGTEGLPSDNQEAREQTAFARMPRPPAPVFVAENAERAVSHIKREGSGPLAFRTEGLVKPQDLSLVPFYRVHHERYAVYWKLQQPTEPVARGE
jgi:DUF1680 family protein